jgi:hypothetical protein
MENKTGNPELRRGRENVKKLSIIAAVAFSLYLLGWIGIWVVHSSIHPCFKRSKYLRQSEAKTNLGSIFTSQVTYFGEEYVYASSLSTLQWEPEYKACYTYTIASADSTSFIARAEGDIDRDPTIDAWEIDQTRTLTNVVNDVTQ